MKYKVLATGSKGNAVIIGRILIDCGVSFKLLAPYIKNIDLVLITHEHSDHLNLKTLKKIQFERPSIRIGICSYLYHKVKDLKNIDILKIGKITDYKSFKIAPFKLYHNVENVGFRLFLDGKKIFYATDTNTLDGISAKDYNLYMIEANFSESSIDKIIADKKEKGEFAHEIQSKKNHLSLEKAIKWLNNNANDDSKCVYLHMSDNLTKEWS